MTTATADPLLDPVAQTFGLSPSELGQLFGVSRQAVEQWRERGIPAARQEKAATLASIAELLRRQLRAERIPGIARRPAAAYGDLAMLDLVRADRHRELLERIRASFDWSSPL